MITTTTTDIENSRTVLEGRFEAAETAGNYELADELHAQCIQLDGMLVSARRAAQA